MTFTRKVLVAVGIILCLTGLTAAGWVIWSRANSSAEPQPSVAELKRQEDFQEQALPILAEFKNQYRADDSGVTQAAATQARDKLLALTVPGSFKDLDISLVVALGKFTPADSAEGKRAYNQIIDRYSWLTSVKLP
jgi:hypothetical protein